MEKPELPTLEDIAMWLGELLINLKMSEKRNRKLTEENEKLKQEKINET